MRIFFDNFLNNFCGSFLRNSQKTCQLDKLGLNSNFYKFSQFMKFSSRFI